MQTSRHRLCALPAGNFQPYHGLLQSQPCMKLHLQGGCNTKRALALRWPAAVHVVVSISSAGELVLWSATLHPETGKLAFKTK